MQGVSADEEVSYDSVARACPSPATLLPEASCLAGRLVRYRIELDAEKSQRFVELIGAPEVRANLRPYDIAGGEGTGVVRGAQGISRPLAESTISSQHVQQYR